MYNYLCLNPIAEVGLSRFSDLYQKSYDMSQSDVILVRSADMNNTEITDNIIAIARAGAGVNNIPLTACAEKGIVVFNTPGANANGVKEMVFAGMLLAARDIIGGIDWIKNNADDANIAKSAEKAKKQFAGSELSGKKLGVIGLGAIGILVANMATKLGMEVYGYDPFISVDAAWKLSRDVAHISDVNRIYQECDYITIHVPLLESTKGMIGSEQLAMMKPGTVLLNFARDLLVDENAVLDALENGTLRHYVSDFANTVTAGKKGVILTPHLGASTEESEDNCAKMAVDELKDFVENGNIRNSVNYPKCDMGVCMSASRIAICHSNTKQMIIRFTSALSDTNIVNMSNTSRGEFAYTMLDLENAVSEEQLDKIRQIEGVYRVRQVK